MITKGKVVSMHYTLKNASGDVMDQSDKAEPFMYLHGAQQIVPGLEKALDGLKKGDKKNVVVAAKDGYGETDANLRVTVKRNQFPGGAQIEVGAQFQATTPDGQHMMFMVEGIQGDDITINGNHPLAGQALHFDVEITEVRDASKEELAHGHAHGPHGHGH